RACGDSERMWPWRPPFAFRVRTNVNRNSLCNSCTVHARKVRPMRRYWIPILVLVTVIIALLFFGDYLTGRVNREQQDPYTRARRITGYHFGIPFEATIPTVMSEY